MPVVPVVPIIIREVEPEVVVTVVLVVLPVAMVPLVDMLPPSCSRTCSRRGSGMTVRVAGGAIPGEALACGEVSSAGFKVAVVVAPPRVFVVVLEPSRTPLPVGPLDITPVVAEVDDVEPTTEPASGRAADSPLDSAALSPTTIIGSRSADACAPVIWETTQTARPTATRTSTAGRSRDVARVFTSSSIPSQGKVRVRIS